jgi:hypothetical protein
MAVSSLDRMPTDTIADSEGGTVEAMIQAVFAHCDQQYQDSKGQMVPIMEEYRQFWDMYRGEYVPPGDDSPYRDINVPKLAKISDVFKATLSSITWPEKTNPDWLNLVPKKKGSEEDLTNEMLARYAEMVTAGVKNDIIQSEMVEDYDRCLLDLLVTGNMYMLAEYSLDMKFLHKRQVNPEYNEAEPFKVAADGTLHMVPRFIVERQPVVEYDAPRLRRINPMNIYPSELDCEKLTDCESVCIYDTCRLSDLHENDIAQGGQIYARLDHLNEHDMENFVPEVDDYHRSMHATWMNWSSMSVRKMRRVTFIGRLDLKSLFSNLDVQKSDWATFFKLFNINPEWANYQKTWIVEMVNDREVVRLQPLPYWRDELPIIHFGMFRTPNRTLADGLYKRCQYDERVFNYLNRLAIELVTRVAKPPIGMIKNAFDDEWFQLNGGRVDYTPDCIWPLKQTARVEDAIQVLPVSSQPLDYLQKEKNERDRTMSEITLTPFSKQGQAAGGDTATEVQVMENNSNNILVEISKSIGVSFLKPGVRWLLALHHQYDEDTRLVSLPDEAGELQEFPIEPEAWIYDYGVNIVIGNDQGSKAVRAMNFKEFVTSWLPTGFLNIPEVIKEHAKLLDVPYPARMITMPQPEQTPPKFGMNVAWDANLLPPGVQAKLLLAQGVEIDQNDMVAMSMLFNDAALAETEVPAQEALNGGGGGSGDSQQSSATAPAPGGGRNHHAMGEGENRQRGLKDNIGQAKALGALMKNPANGRRATAA